MSNQRYDEIVEFSYKIIEPIDYKLPKESRELIWLMNTGRFKFSKHELDIKEIVYESERFIDGIWVKFLCKIRRV